MRMQGQLLSQISGSVSGALPVASSGAPGRRAYWNEVPSPRLLATPDIWVCVPVYGVFRVKGGGLCFRPETRQPPLPCYLFPPFLPLTTLSLRRLDPVSHLPIHLKAQNAYWDPIWGWGRGAQGALSRGGKHSNNTMKRRRRRREVEDAQAPDRRWLQMASLLRLFFPFLISSLHVSLSVCCHCLCNCFSDIPFWCWHWEVKPAWPCCWEEVGVQTRPSKCVSVCGSWRNPACTYLSLSHTPTVKTFNTLKVKTEPNFWNFYL